MSINETESILRGLAEAGAQNPDLEEYYEFQRGVQKVLAEAKAEVSDVQHQEAGQAVPTAGDRGMSPILRGPMLCFESLPMEGERFTRLVTAVARALRDYDPSFEGEDIPTTPAACLQLARRRFEEGQACNSKGQPGEPATLAQLSVDMALRPYLEWGAEQLASYLDVQTAWRLGCCPVCGGAPDFASLDKESGARRLLCSRCGTQWPYPRFGCPFCGIQDHTKLPYHPGEDGVYRLYVCQECRRYLKTIDLRQVHRVVILPLERITTVAMDAAALEAGYW